MCYTKKPILKSYTNLGKEENERKTGTFRTYLMLII